MNTSKTCLRVLLTTLLSFLPLLSGQAASTKFEAESGTRGSQIAIGTLGPVTYIYPTVDNPTTTPGSATRVTSYSVTFPAAGTYDLYGRLYVGPGAANDDSFFLGNGFGVKSPTTASNWINQNNLSTVGFSNPTDVVTGTGTVGSQVWKWINLSKFTGGVSFTVPSGALTQTFQIGSREDGLFFDAFLFGTTTYSFTVADLDAGAGGTPPAPPNGTVNFNTVYQQLDGFGGAIAYDCENLIVHPKKQEIYDLLFRDLGVDILRVRNTYGYPDNGLTMNASAQVVATARGYNPTIKTELVPWSCPAYLKSNNDINNGGTLKGGPSNYIYNDYAQWWSDSVKAWQAVGVNPDFVSIQNEPDFTATYDSLRLNATESTTIAGYDKAFEAVTNKFNADFGAARPEMWGPETSGYATSRAYNNALIARGQLANGNLGGFSFHPYGDGSYDSPDAFVSSQMTYYTQYGIGTASPFAQKPLHMTELVKNNTTPNFQMAWEFAWHIYNFLYKMHVTSYFNWTLFRGPSPTGGGIVTMTSATDYVIRPQYWYLKAYAHFTDPNWWLVDTATNSSNVRISAFKSPTGDALTVVVLNVTTTPTTLSPLNINGGFAPKTSQVYMSSATDNWAYQGTFTPGGSVTVPANGIVTIAMTANHAPVANAGADQNAEAGSVITLDAGASYDADSGDVLTYQWTLTNKPVGSAAALDNAAAIHPKFTADRPGSYLLSLKVNDGTVDSAVDTMTVNVVDTVSPVVNWSVVTPNSLGLPYGLMKPVSVSVNASDVGDPAPASSIVCVSSNQVISSPADYTTSGATAMLKNVSGRGYCLKVQTMDASGNASYSWVKVSCGILPLPPSVIVPCCP